MTAPFLLLVWVGCPGNAQSLDGAELPVRLWSAIEAPLMAESHVFPTSLASPDGDPLPSDAERFELEGPDPKSSPVPLEPDWPTPGQEERLPSDRSSSEEERAHGSISGFLRTHGSGRAWGDNVWRDYLTEPPVLFPVALGVSAAAISHWDRPLENRAMGLFGSQKSIANATAGVLILGSLGLGTLFPGPGRNWWDELWTEGEAYLVATGITSGLKVAVQRHRPGGSGRSHSFPSDHATLAFTGATLIELNSGPELGIPAFLVAGACAVSRMETGDHFPSDVLAGASIGVLVAGIFDALHWGTGREGRGISGPPLEVQMGWDRGAGFTVGKEFGF